MFFTRDGLEQATRPAVADHHAHRFVAAGVRRVVDLGCGIGSDALAFARAGLEVVAVERDPETAAVAAANLAGRATVVCADAEQVAGDLLADGSAVFADPARRTERGRVWRLAEVTPPWSFVARLLDGRRPAGVKLAPALPHAEIPAAAEAEWLSHRGEVVEAGLWAGPAPRPAYARRWSGPPTTRHRSGWRRRAEAPLPVRELGDYLYEPDGAVIRAGAIADVGLLLGAGLLDPHVAYLTADRLQTTPFATAYAVHDQLPYRRKVLHRWLVEHGIGRLEIKRRGLDFDPAVLRRELRPAGPEPGDDDHLPDSARCRGGRRGAGRPIRQTPEQSRARALCWRAQQHMKEISDAPILRSDLGESEEISSRSRRCSRDRDAARRTTGLRGRRRPARRSRPTPWNGSSPVTRPHRSP